MTSLLDQPVSHGADTGTIVRVLGTWASREKKINMILAHKIALDPTDAQRTYFTKACGVARMTYNWGLAEWKEQYEAGGRPCERELRRYFNSLKDERFPFVREITKCAPQLALMNLGTAFKNFFAGTAKFPKFKKKGKSRDSFEISNDQLGVDGHRVRIPNLGWVRMREPLRFAGRIIAGTVSRTAGRWFIAITIDVPDKVPPNHDGPAAGIDFGCANFATLSTGETVAGPKPHKALLGRLRRLNRSMSRKTIGSRNRTAAAFKVAELHSRIANTRRDFLHKFTTDVCRRFSVIGIEDLNISGMAKTTLARSVLDQSFYEARRQLTYKAPMHGCALTVADRFFPSSKLCSACGVKCNSLPISMREWTCANCGAVHDRDGNASLNLKQIAVSSTVTACGVLSADVGTRNVKLGTLKQEPNTRNAVGLFG